MDELRSARLDAALERAVREGDVREFSELLRRNSGLPGPRPNLDLARALAQAIAAHGGRADALLRAMLATDDEYSLIVGALALGARALRGIDRKGALEHLQVLAEEPRQLVRLGVVETLRLRIGSQGSDGVAELSTWTDGYFQAHVVLEAIAHRSLLAALPDGAEPEVLARLDEAFVLADKSPRSAERSQGMRSLRAGLPGQIAVIAARFSGVFPWIEEKAKVQRPESREVVSQTISALRRASLSDADSRKLASRLEASAPPPRDPSRIVHGTRRRAKGRT